MRNRWNATLVAGLIATGLFVIPAPSAEAVPPGAHAEPRSPITTTALTSSKSLTVKKQSYTRKYTKNGCDKGVRFWSAAGDHGRSCAAGPKNLTLSWRDILKTGDSNGKKRTYTKVPVRWDEHSPIDGRATVTVKGRAVTAKWCHDKTCTTYYGARNGRKWTGVWGTSKHSGKVHGTPVTVKFSSVKNAAKPVAVLYAIYD